MLEPGAESVLNENCGRSLVGTNFVRKDDKPYCKLCPTDKEQAKQKKLGRVYHPEHFVCTKCDKPFNGTQYFEDEGKPYCELHYKEVTGALCQFCRKAVKGKMISALGSKWCEAHFMCMGCFAPLNDFERSKFMDFDTKPFCRRCYDKLPSDTKRNTKKYAESEKKYLPTPA
ncbi:LIM and senescent cell antigen-like-containing domain protein 2 [Boothiomyces macroporosus]|uniref:LIM and senescent cell antigen-like-containing domain protein 2 n=1 Tax=Boothiomyces macroporosus TaxID=261099 RepID=A0AAD5Y867_9FUNG|nr:LIM and senescent cell antigen-like-containing domain protein 2 [Boothiomyces macroporosus]